MRETSQRPSHHLYFQLLQFELKFETLSVVDAMDLERRSDQREIPEEGTGNIAYQQPPPVPPPLSHPSEDRADASQCPEGGGAGLFSQPVRRRRHRLRRCLRRILDRPLAVHLHLQALARPWSHQHPPLHRLSRRDRPQRGGVGLLSGALSRHDHAAAATDVRAGAELGGLAGGHPELPAGLSSALGEPSPQSHRRRGVGVDGESGHLSGDRGGAQAPGVSTTRPHSQRPAERRRCWAVTSPSTSPPAAAPCPCGSTSRHWPPKIHRPLLTLFSDTFPCRLLCFQNLRRFRNPGLVP